jgi:DNA-binding XRE family transcriptional regulator
VHRFRSHWLELGRRLRAFRARYGLTQDEVAAVVGAKDGTALAQWERGTNVPDGLRRERLTALLEGRLWPELRAALIGGDGIPSRWHQGVRWYRRASRKRGLRDRAGTVVSAILDELRALGSPEALRRRYVEADGEWAHALADQRGCGDACRADLRRIEDAWRSWSRERCSSIRRPCRASPAAHARGTAEGF